MTLNLIISYHLLSAASIDIGRNRYIEMLMGSLPLDLFRPVVENLAGDFGSLLAISLVSHDLRMEGQRILFRKVVLSFCADSHAKFLTVIASSSLLASLVKEYHLFDLRYKVEPFWGLTCRGLQAMVNLKILRFCTLRGEKVSAEILHACTFQLEIFQWNNRNHDDTEQVSVFLQTQPHLRVLSVFWHGPDLVTSDICPRLQVLHGDQYTINAFLPGRRITSLKWTPDDEELLINDPVDHLSEELHYIRFFSFGSLPGPSRLDLVVPHLRAVEVLEVGLHSLAGPELQLLSEIPTLQILILYNRSHAHHSVLFKSQRLCEECFSNLFASCSALQHIYVAVHSKRLYRRWSRDPSQQRNDIFDAKEVLLPEWNMISAVRMELLK